MDPNATAHTLADGSTKTALGIAAVKDHQTITTFLTKLGCELEMSVGHVLTTRDLLEINLAGSKDMTREDVLRSAKIGVCLEEVLQDKIINNRLFLKMNR